ncbi:MAG: hypothetical protein KKA07_00065 [Bacteroidetes bacterium]|nr:hypothetical protein [Bacteroidota bacterium]MBU1717444.1 hypothetical protein [Bacteroidota bacterium]
MNTNFTKKLEVLNRLCEEHRGKIISGTISIEAVLSEILIDLISTEQTRSCFAKHLFSDAITLETKVNLFCSLNKKKAFLMQNENCNLNNDLKYIQIIRNRIAHSLLDTSQEFINQFDNSFVKYKSFTTEGEYDLYIYYTDVEENPGKRIYNAKEIFKKINRTLISLAEIQEKLISVVGD